MISLEIRLCQQEADRRDLVDQVFDWEGVFGTKQCKEVVRPEVVADKVEGSHPNVRLERIALVPLLGGFGGRRPENGNQHTRSSTNQANGVVTKVTDALKCGGRKHAQIDRGIRACTGRKSTEHQGCDVQEHRKGKVGKKGPTTYFPETENDHNAEEANPHRRIPEEEPLSITLGRITGQKWMQELWRRAREDARQLHGLLGSVILARFGPGRGRRRLKRLINLLHSNGSGLSSPSVGRG